MRRAIGTVVLVVVVAASAVSSCGGGSGASTPAATTVTRTTTHVDAAPATVAPVSTPAVDPGDLEQMDRSGYRASKSIVRYLRSFSNVDYQVATAALDDTIAQADDLYGSTAGECRTSLGRFEFHLRGVKVGVVALHQDVALLDSASAVEDSGVMTRSIKAATRNIDQIGRRCI